MLIRNDVCIQPRTTLTLKYDVRMLVSIYLMVLCIQNKNLANVIFYMCYLCKNVNCIYVKMEYECCFLGHITGIQNGTLYIEQPCRY